MVKTSKRRKSVETADELAEFFGVTVRTVREWRSKKDFPGSPDGPFCIVDIAEWRYRTFDLRSVDNVDSPDAEVKKRRQIGEMLIAEEEAKAKALKNRQAEGELVSRDAVKRWLSGVFTYLRQRYEAFPVRIASRFPEDIRVDLLDETQRFVALELRYLSQQSEKYEEDIE